MLLDWRVAPSLLLAATTFFIILAIVGPLVVDDRINKTLEQKFLFTSDSGLGYERWVSNERNDSSPSYIYVYLYNTTNPAEAAKGARPYVEEVGPYVYRQYLRNVNATFDYIDNERVVTFTPYIYFIFDKNNPDNEGRSELDNITAPSYGFWSVFAVAPAATYPLFLNHAKQAGVGAFDRRPVHEWLFGFNDTFLMSVKQYTSLQTTVVQYIKNQSSPEDAYNQVKTSTLSCGFPATSRFQQFIKWQANTNVRYWASQPTVTGSPGTFFGFFRRGAGHSEYHFWNTLARTLEMELKYVTTDKGVEVYRYRFLDKELYNATEYPANAQYNQFGPRGLFNATSILNSPVFYSWPHFYLGDPVLGSQIDGLKPASEDDESFLDVQPVIGANCRSSRKLQGNILFGNLTDPVYTQISVPGPRYVYPLFWIDIRSEITEEQAEEMVTSLDFYHRAQVGEVWMLYGGCIGATLSFLTSVCMLYHRRHYWNKGGRDGHLLTGFADYGSEGDGSESTSDIPL